MSHRAVQISSRLALTVWASAAFATVAQAGGRLHYVSSTGSNANACTLAAPCKTLARAVKVTEAGGEVRVLDSSEFGRLTTITQSVTITGGGATVFAGAITINDASAVVSLRGLVLNGAGTAAGTSGITIQAAAAVHIEGCTIHNFPGDGIQVAGGNADLSVTDSTFRENGRDGVFVNNDATGSLSVDNSRFIGNLSGVATFNPSGSASVNRSLAFNNSEAGIEVLNGGTMNVTATVLAQNGRGFLLNIGGNINLVASTVRGNTSEGLYVFTSNSTARISDSVFTNNGTGINNKGTVLTRQNNTVSGNTSNILGNAFTPLAGI